MKNKTFEIHVNGLEDIPEMIAEYTLGILPLPTAENPIIECDDNEINEFIDGLAFDYELSFNTMRHYYDVGITVLNGTFYLN